MAIVDILLEAAGSLMQILFKKRNMILGGKIIMQKLIAFLKVKQASLTSQCHLANAES